MEESLRGRTSYRTNNASGIDQIFSYRGRGGRGIHLRFSHAIVFRSVDFAAVVAKDFPRLFKSLVLRKLYTLKLAYMVHVEEELGEILPVDLTML